MSEPGEPPRVPMRDSGGPVAALVDAVRLGLGVPLALVAFASDDPWAAAFLPASGAQSLSGYDVPLAPVLADAVRQSGAPLAIEDARTHPLVRGIPVVRGVRVLSLLAAPLRDTAGVTHGALCAFDGVPRWWSDNDVRLLDYLAQATAALLAPPPASERPLASAVSVSERAPETAVIPMHERTLAPAVAPVHEREAMPVAAPVGEQETAPVAAPADERERAVSESEPVAADVLAGVTDGLLLVDADWKVRWANAALADCLGMSASSLAGRDVRTALASVVDAAVLAAWQRAVDTGWTTSFTWHHQHTDRWFEGRANPGAGGLTIALRDITLVRLADDARERRLSELHEARKLEAVGLLAGGVAHDFNNLLTVIAANTELLRQTPLADTGTTEIDEIHRAASRAAVVTRQLLAFGRRQTLEPCVVSLNHVVGALEPALRRLLPATVRIESSLTTAGSNVRIDPDQLEQVVMQLAANARDAMPDGGALRITTTVTHLVEPQAARPAPVPAGTWVVLTLTDTGHGVAPHLLDRIFEPFFTTRDVGNGLGLGLSAAYGVVVQSGGVCTVESEPGGGAEFRVWLPAARAGDW